MSGQLIAFTGRMRAGKSTAAMVAVVEHGAIRRSFADRVRHECAQVLSVVVQRPMHELEAAMRAAATKEHFRGLMQWWGAWRRASDPLYWIKLLEPGVALALARHQHVVIDDVRYANEAQWVRELGGRLVCVHREDAPQSDDVSEQDWQTIVADAHLWNGDGIDAFRSRAGELLADWL